MAQEIPFKVIVDTLRAEKSVAELREEFASLNKAIDEVKLGSDEYNKLGTRLAAVKTVLSEVTTDVDKLAGANVRAATSVSPLQREFRQLRNAIEGGKLSAEETEKALIRMGQVKGQIRDLAQQVNALDPERKFAAFAKIGSTVASGFAAAQAATALFGSENEDLVKTLVKVQAATALAQGLQGLAGMSKAIKEVSLAMKAFALSNPFTAILAAVVAVTVAVYAMVKSFSASAREMDRLKKAAEDLEQQLSNTQKFWADQLKLIEAQGASIEKLRAFTRESFKQQIEDLDQAIKVKQRLAEKGDDEAIKELSKLEAEREHIITESRISELNFEKESNKQKEEEFKKTNDREIDFLKDKIKAEVKANEEAAKAADELQKANLEMWKARLIARGEFDLEQQIEYEKRKRDLVLSNAESTDAERINAEAAFLTAVSKLRSEANEKSWKEQLEILDKSIDDSIKVFERETEAYIKSLGDKEEAARKYYDDLISLQLENAAARAELDDDPVAGENTKFQREMEDFGKFKEEKLAAINAQAEEEILLAGDNEIKIGQIKIDAKNKSIDLGKELDIKEQLLKDAHEKKLTDITKAAATQRRQMQIDLAKSGFEMVGNLAAAFAGKSVAQQKQAFNIQKAANIATATIDTYVAAQKAYASQIIPLDPTSVFRASLAAGIAVVSGLARVAMIAKTQFNASGGGEAPSTGAGGGGGDFSAPSAPAVQPPQVTATTTNTNQEGDFQGFNRPKTPELVRAYVVETEITDTQKRVNSIERRSEF